MANELTAKALELREKLRAQLAAEQKPASESDYGDFDSNDWGRTESNDTTAGAEAKDAEDLIESAEAETLDSADLASGQSLDEADLEDELSSVDLDDPDLDDDMEFDGGDGELEWGRTASEEAIMAELESDSDEPSAPSEPAARTGVSDWAWPESLTPGTSSKPTPKPAAANAAAPTAPETATAEAAPAEAATAESPAQAAPAQAGAALRQELSKKSRETTLMQLAKQGVKNVKVLGMATIEKIVEKAVATAIEKSVVGHSIEDAKRIEEDARREFFKLLKKHKKVLAEKSTTQQQHTELAGQVEELSRELAEAEAALTHERRAAGTTLSQETLGDLETTFRGLLDGFMTDERRELIKTDDPQSLKGLVDLEKKLGEAFDRLLDRVKSQAEELLERRIGKLNAALEETETALRQLALSKGFDEGIASIYDTIQGLSPSEADFARKKELLALVFVENLEIQELELTDDDRKNYAEALSALEATRAQRSAPLKAPTGFAKPVETTTTDVAF